MWRRQGNDHRYGRSIMTQIGGPRVLRPGEAVPIRELAGGGLAPRVVHIGLSALDPAPDHVAFLVGAQGKVRTDDDFVFYNQPASGDGAVTHSGRHEGTEWLRVDLAALDADVERVVFGSAGGSLDMLSSTPLTLSMSDGATTLGIAQFSTEPDHQAIVLLELYRRNGEWRCRLLAQGYAGGLAALATGYGVDVEDAPPESLANPADVMPTRVHHNAPVEQQTAPNFPPDQAVPMPAATTSTPGTSLAYVQPVLLAQGSDGGRRGGLFTSRKRQQLEAQNAELARILTSSGALDNAAIATERARLAGEVAALAAEAERRRAHLVDLDQRLGAMNAAIATAEGDADLVEVGIYRYRHRLDDAVAYKSRIDALRERIRAAGEAQRRGNGRYELDGQWLANRRPADGH
jgi:stress response protein SCP2